MRIPDFHLHSNFSPDSSMLREDAVTAACAAGITDLCFTEHMDLGHEEERFNRIPANEQMRLSLEQLQSCHPDLRFYHGLEVGYLPQTARQTADILAQRSLDYVLLSVHCMNGHDCYNPLSCLGLTRSQAYSQYLEAVFCIGMR